jgi:hypothetical protein
MSSLEFPPDGHDIVYGLSLSLVTVGRLNPPCIIYPILRTQPCIGLAHLGAVLCLGLVFSHAAQPAIDKVQHVLGFALVMGRRRREGAMTFIFRVQG